MHRERHSIERIGWLRAAVLGANDGIVSTASLLLGVAAASASHSALMIAGVAGWVAGAMSMATGEYVSVSSQADTEKAALAEEQAELLEDYPGEFRELTSIYVHRGLDPALARQVAEKLMAHDALEAHARDELGISAATRARPLQAALASALSFSLGALLPLLVALWVPVALDTSGAGGIGADFPRHSRRHRCENRRCADLAGRGAYPDLERHGDGGFLRRRHAVWRRGRLAPRLHQSAAPQVQYLSFVSRRRSRHGDGNAKSVRDIYAKITDSTVGCAASAVATNGRPRAYHLVQSACDNAGRRLCPMSA